MPKPEKHNWLGPAQYARKHGVSRQRVWQWIAEGRLEGYLYRPTEKVTLISADAPRPEPRPGGRPPTSSEE